MKPLLKYAGGKTHLLPRLRPLWRGHQARRLVEPFCGALSVALGLRPVQAMLNDVNEHVVNFHRWAARSLVLPWTAADNDRGRYEALRAEFNALVERGTAGGPRGAQLFWYLNHHGYNGLCRFNSKGLYNTPFGKYKHVWTPAPEMLGAFRQAAAHWTFTSRDFAACAVDEGSFVYCDPPYPDSFSGYAAGGFSWEDQLRLVAWATGLPCPVVVSNRATPEVLAAYTSAGFQHETFLAPRRISCTGDRVPAQEMLAWRNLDAPFVPMALTSEEDPF